MKKLKRGKTRVSSSIPSDTALANLIDTTVEEWYVQKHRSISIDEVTFINSLDINCCPYCKGKRFIIYDHRKDGIKRLFCKDCKRKFNPLTGTLFDSHKIAISEWIEYIYHLLSYESVMISTYSNRNDKNTGYYWLSKIFLAIEDIQDNTILKGRIYLDETYLSVMPKDIVYKDGKKLRGISRNKICIMTAIDSYGNIIIKSNGKGKPSRLRIIEAFNGHIKEGSTLVHDGENSHKGLIDKYHLKEEIHPTKETKGLSDEDNPMNPINSVHRRLKAFMREHGSYNRDNIQDWMNLVYFVLINQGDNKAERAILNLLKRVISSSKIHRFSEFKSKHK